MLSNTLPRSLQSSKRQWPCNGAPARGPGAKRQYVLADATSTWTKQVARRTLRCYAAQAGIATQSSAKKQGTAEDVQVDSVTTHPCGQDVWLVRGNCRSRLKYEIEYGRNRGTTDNAYLIKAGDNAVLIDVHVNAYASKFVPALESLTPLNALTHIIITQMDPKAIPTLESVMNRAVAGRQGAKLQLVLSNPAAKLLQSALGEQPERAQLLSEVQLVIAKSGHQVALADGPGAPQLECLLTSTPRWPDLMAVYYANQQLLFTSKLFSAHVAPSVAAASEAAVGGVPAGSEASAFDVGGWDVYGEDWKFFFDCMLAPVARQASVALEKLDIVPMPRVAPPQGGTKPRRTAFGRFGRWLGSFIKDSMRPSRSSSNGSNGAPAAGDSTQMIVTSVLPMHGPVVASSLTQLLREYRGWTDEQIKSLGSGSVAVLYASAYGNTTALAQAISRGITKGGVAAEMINLELVSIDEVTSAVKQASGFVLGSPTLGGHMPTQVQVALGAIIREQTTKGLPCGVFGSFGWSGEAVDEMEGRLKDSGYGFAFKPIRVKFKPTSKDLQVCEESGRALALQVKRKLKAKETSQSAGDVKQSLASGCQLAMGRVIGSLAVVTANDEDASSAMLASWISQASFDPPGLTVSVKKDRAMEPLLVVGNKFNVSMIPEGKDKVIMRKLTKFFTPGEDRLADLETFESETTHAAVLKDANAYLECQVQSRMEAGDHWVVYATVIGGKVLDENVQTAVHHRKVGNHY